MHPQYLRSQIVVFIPAHSSATGPNLPAPRRSTRLPGWCQRNLPVYHGQAGALVTIQVVSGELVGNAVTEIWANFAWDVSSEHLPRERCRLSMLSELSPVRHLTSWGKVKSVVPTQACSSVSVRVFGPSPMTAPSTSPKMS